VSAQESPRDRNPARFSAIAVRMFRRSRVDRASHLRGLTPKVRGVGVGERLSIIWPGAQTPSGYIAETTCDPLALLTALFPDRMPRDDRGRAHGQ
jgi:hypothetical protein